MIWDNWIIRTSRIKDLFINYFKYVQLNESIPGIPKGMPLNQTAIDKCALSFLTTNCGTLDYKITDDSNLNNDILDMFARTFVRHFWNNRIAYNDNFVFWTKLRSFLDENMPMWIQFYKEAVIDNKALIDNVANISINNNGYINVDTDNESKGNTYSQSNTKTNDKTVGNTINSNNGIVTNITDSNGNTNSKGHNRQLNANADTPQDQLGSGIGNNGNEDPLRDYDFNYASSINGDNGYNDNNATTNNHSEETSNNNGKANVINNANANGTSDSKDNTNVKSNDHGKSHQENNATVRQNNESRNQSLFAIAEQMNELANGAYANLFLKMKQEDLFLGTYC